MAWSFIATMWSWVITLTLPVAVTKMSPKAELEAKGISVEPITDRALLALQGPEAEAVLDRLVPGVAAMKFMDVAEFDWNGAVLWVSRSGYTGEDGYEISVPEAQAVALAEALLDQPEVAPIGLGARDSLRLEAACRFTATTWMSPPAPPRRHFGWSIPKTRRQAARGRRDFRALTSFWPNWLVAPRAHGAGCAPRAAPRSAKASISLTHPRAAICWARSARAGSGRRAGGPIAMAILLADLTDGATVWAELRGKRMAVTLSPLPFHKPSYKR